MHQQDPRREFDLMLTRRQLFGHTALGVGTAAMASFLAQDLAAAGSVAGASEVAIELGGKPECWTQVREERIHSMLLCFGQSVLDLFQPVPVAARPAPEECADQHEAGELALPRDRDGLLRPLERSVAVAKYAMHVRVDDERLGEIERVQLPGQLDRFLAQPPSPIGTAELAQDNRREASRELSPQSLAPGSLLLLSPGTYDEVGPLILDKGVTLTSPAPAVVR